MGKKIVVWNAIYSAPSSLDDTTVPYYAVDPVLFIDWTLSGCFSPFLQWDEEEHDWCKVIRNRPSVSVAVNIIYAPWSV